MMQKKKKKMTFKTFYSSDTSLRLYLMKKIRRIPKTTQKITSKFFENIIDFFPCQV